MVSDAGAVYNVNVNGGDGKVKGGKSKSNEEKALIGILKELKGIGKIFGKATKLSASGLGGGSGLLGGLLGAVGGIGSAALGIAGGATSGAGILGGMKLGQSFNDLTTEKALIDGQEKIIKADKKTGEIVEILTIREAQEQGLVDKNGNILKRYEVANSKFKQITEGYAKWENAVVLTSEQVGKLSSSIYQETLVQDHILELQKKREALIAQQVSNLARSLRGGSSSNIKGEGFTDFSSRQSVDTSGGATAGFLQQFTRESRLLDLAIQAQEQQTPTPDVFLKDIRG